MPKLLVGQIHEIQMGLWINMDLIRLFLLIIPQKCSKCNVYIS